MGGEIFPLSGCGGKALSPFVSGGMILCLLNTAGSWLRGKLGMLCSGVGNGFSSKVQHGGNTAVLLMQGCVGLSWGGLKPGKGEILA